MLASTSSLGQSEEFISLELKINSIQPLFYRCLKVETEPHEVLILSDLNDTNYFMENRFEKLGVSHAEVTLAKLAKFHAASILYKENVRRFGKTN